jgi:hypothetical protein
VIALFVRELRVAVRDDAVAGVVGAGDGPGGIEIALLRRIGLRPAP